MDFAANAVPLIFRGAQEMLVFLVAMVCIIYIPHLLEPYCPAQQLPGFPEGTYAGSKAKHMAIWVRNEERHAAIILSSKDMFEMPPGYQKALQLSTDGG